MPRLLHVGCSEKRKSQTTPVFATDEWEEIRLDIDPGVKPDIVANMTDMAQVAAESVDAVYSSHNLEHLFAHEVPAALREFLRVLKPDGFAVIGCPDLQAAAALIADDKLLEPAYASPAGPISAHDVIYGYGEAIARGHVFMAHKSGFTARTLIAALNTAGFQSVALLRRPAGLELWSYASKTSLSHEALREKMARHFP